MKQEFLTIQENTCLAPGVYRLVLDGVSACGTAASSSAEAAPVGTAAACGLAAIRPGQFVNLALPGRYLRRPISVCDYDAEKGTLTLIYKVVGAGTGDLSGFRPGMVLDVLTGLGNGYDLACSGPKPLLLGGGAGVPPMYYAAKELLRRGAEPTVILGFNTRSEVFYEEEFRALGCAVTVTTVDGSYGAKGFVTDAVQRPETAGEASPYSYFYACGPLPMLKAIYRLAMADGLDGEFSLEERMGCGFGACMGCSVHTADGGYKRVCKDGPVFRKEELPW